MTRAHLPTGPSALTADACLPSPRTSTARYEQAERDAVISAIDDDAGSCDIMEMIKTDVRG
jgi:hypothetical protein